MKQSSFDSMTHYKVHKIVREKVTKNSHGKFIKRVSEGLQKFILKSFEENEYVEWHEYLSKCANSDKFVDVNTLCEIFQKANESRVS